MPEYEKGTLEKLMDGKLSWHETKSIMSSFKDADRFDKYVQILQDRVPYDDRILLPLALHLNIVQKKDGARVVKCDCGHEFGDYKENWKLGALVYVRDSEEKMQEVYPPLMHSNTSWIVLREYYCPGCRTQLEVEAVPPRLPGGLRLPARPRDVLQRVARPRTVTIGARSCTCIPHTQDLTPGERRCRC